MDTDISALAAVARTYFDAAYEMDADRFASVFHPTCSVTRVGDDGTVSVVSLETWLAAVRTLESPRARGLERRDRILTIDVVRELALLKLELQAPPRHMTDMLVCLRVDGVWKIAQKTWSLEIR
jgi:hypothetical protein